MGDGSGLIALIAAIASAIALAISSLRKRQDVSIEEMQKRIAALSEDLEAAETQVERLQVRIRQTEAALLQAEADRFALRRVLAAEGITDPTLTGGST